FDRCGSKPSASWLVPMVSVPPGLGCLAAAVGCGCCTAPVELVACVGAGVGAGAQAASSASTTATSSQVCKRTNVVLLISLLLLWIKRVGAVSKTIQEGCCACQ